MSNEPNKPIEAEELKEKELEGVAGGMGRLKLPEQKIEPDVFLLVPMRRVALDRAKVAGR